MSRYIMQPTQRRPFRSGSKILALHDRLRELAYSKGPDAKLPTARQLCETYGTTTTALNSALRELELQNVIYRKQGSGIYVSPRIYSKSILLALGSSYFEQPGASPFWDLLSGAFIKEAQRRGDAHDEIFTMHLVMQSDRTREGADEKFVRLIESETVHGVLGIGLDWRSADCVIDHNIPVVAYGGSGRYFVVHDMQSIIDLGVTALAEKGCRRVGLWLGSDPCAPSTKSPNPEECISGEVNLFRQALERNGLTFHPELVKANLPSEHLGSRQEQGYRFAYDVFGTPDKVRPDGLLLTEDMLTSGAIGAFSELNIQLERDVQIASHSNTGSPLLFAFDKKMTILEIDPREIVLAMFATLDELLQGERPADPVRYIRYRRRN